MPIFEYHCEQCNKKTEKIVSFIEADKQVCECGKLLTRDVSCPHIKFGDSFIRNFRDEATLSDELGKPYKGRPYYDDEYVEKQDEQGIGLV